MTNSTPSAWSSAPRVMIPCAESSPPTPGVSIKQSPARRIRRGSRTSTDRRPRRFPGFPVSDTQPATESIGTGSVRGSPSRAGTLEVRCGARGFAVADDGGDHRDLVGVDRADGRLQQRVDQGALASLEFADDGHRDRAVVEPGAGTVQRDGQIGAVLGNGQFPALVQPRHRLLDQALLTREFVGVGATGDRFAAAGGSARGRGSARPAMDGCAVAATGAGCLAEVAQSGRETG